MRLLEILPADLLLIWAHGVIPELIENVTHGPSHVAMFVNAERLEEAQGGRSIGECALSLYLQSGARLEVWGDPSLTDAERAEMVRFAHTLYGKRYDYALIPLELLHFECGLPLGWYHNDDAFICSGDIDTVARHVGHIWSKTANPAPVDFIQGGVLQKKGDLSLKVV